MKDPTVVSRKLAVLGFRAVGKSSLINSFVVGSFSTIYDPTIEGTLHKTIRFRKVHFATDIVDTAGMVNANAMIFTYANTWSHIVSILFHDPLNRTSIHDFLATHPLAYTDIFWCLV
jgi:GTPase SAR1 family protein